MIRKIIISSVFLLAMISSQAQNLDRITISTGGNSTNEVSYSIGETFNLALSDGDFTLDMGSQGSEDDTGGNTNYVSVENVISDNNQVACYPNPTNGVIYFTAGKTTSETLFVQIIDINGKIVFSKSVTKSVIMDCDLTNLTAGNYILSISDENRHNIGSAKFVKQ